MRKKFNEPSLWDTLDEIRYCYLFKNKSYFPGYHQISHQYHVLSLLDISGVFETHTFEEF